MTQLSLAQLFSLLLLTAFSVGAADGRPRLLVLTDIGGDPDDQQSMIRLLHYSNEFEIEGFIASATGGKRGQKKAVINPQLIHELIDAYGEVRNNLVLHDARYPTAEHLRTLVKTGTTHRGREGIGNEGDTEASRWIIALGDKVDSRPLNISIWGGQTDFGQALWRVRQDRGEGGLKRWIARLRIYDIGDQDDLAGWLHKEFPGMFYVMPKPISGEDRRESVFRGMYLGGDESLTSRAWVDRHIRTKHGALGALYPTRTWTAPNPHSTMKEGDTPSWFFFLPNGLSDPAHPDWGGWGGRFTLNKDHIWRDAMDTHQGKTHRRVTVWRWRPQFQADFQARLDWAVRPVAEANHPPMATLNSDGTRHILRVQSEPGAPTILDASASTDPDGDNLSFHWWTYPEAGNTEGLEMFNSQTQARITITIPVKSKAEQWHVILEVTDDGEPSLTSYRHILVER